jgi:hypothetical protein
MMPTTPVVCGLMTDSTKRVRMMSARKLTHWLASSCGLPVASLGLSAVATKPKVRSILKTRYPKPGRLSLSPAKMLRTKKYERDELSLRRSY